MRARSYVMVNIPLADLREDFLWIRGKRHGNYGNLKGVDFHRLPCGLIPVYHQFKPHISRDECLRRRRANVGSLSDTARRPLAYTVAGFAATLDVQDHDSSVQSLHG